MTSSLSDYRKLCERHHTQYLKDCLRWPSPYMRPIHLAIIALVIRNREA
jgi:hypothetical protein